MPAAVRPVILWTAPGKTASGPAAGSAREPDLEVPVPLKVIGVETQAKLKGNEPDSIDDTVLCPRWSTACRPAAKYPLQPGSKQVRSQKRPVPVRTGIPRRIAAGAQGIAEVMEQKARLDRVQVNEADNLFAGVVKKKVGHLGIAVDDTVTDSGAGRCSSRLTRARSLVNEPVTEFVFRAMPLFTARHMTWS